jgi:hypothetical protein
MRYVKLIELLDRLKSNNIMADLNYEAVVIYVTDFFQILNSPKLLKDYKTDLDIEIKDYMGKLPCNFVKEVQLRMRYHNNDKAFIPMRRSTDTFHPTEKQYCYQEGPSDLTYTINNGMIYTSFRNGYVEMAYRGIVVDEDGMPMVPENFAIMRALIDYIKVQYYTILVENMRMPYQVLQMVEQRYAWSIGRASTQLHQMSLDEAENFTNIVNRLIPDLKQHDKYYASLGSKEYLRTQ